MERVPASITIRDVAHLARVGVGTVSRFLNGGVYVSASTRDRIIEAIRRLGYRPNAQARRIMRHRAEMVCFLLNNRDFLHPFHARILQGVATHASASKHHVVFAVVHYGPGTPPDRIPLPPILTEKGWVDGLILSGTIYPNFLRKIKKTTVPFVTFGNNVFSLARRRDFDEVSFDDLQGEFEATQYVIKCGHRVIAFVGDTFLPWFRRRKNGYLHAMKESGLNPLLLTTRRGGSFSEYGDWAASHLLSSNPRPTAIIAANDEIAFGIWRSFRRLGVKVPEEVSLVGFDDREEALMMDPPLTTMRVHKEEIGQALVKLLLEKLDKPTTQITRLMLPVRLIVRGSVRNLP